MNGPRDGSLGMDSFFQWTETLLYYPLGEVSALVDTSTGKRNTRQARVRFIAPSLTS